MQNIGLNFSNCGLRAPEMLEKLYSKGRNIHLFLDMNQLHLDCFEDIAIGIGSRTDLEQVTLSLNSVRIPAESLLKICDVLEPNSALEVLTLNLKKYFLFLKGKKGLHVFGSLRNGLKAQDVDDVLERLGKLTSLREINLNMEKNEASGLSGEDIESLFANAEELVGINIKLEKDN